MVSAIPLSAARSGRRTGVLPTELTAYPCVCRAARAPESQCRQGDGRELPPRGPPDGQPRSQPRQLLVEAAPPLVERVHQSRPAQRLPPHGVPDADADEGHVGSADRARAQGGGGRQAAQAAAEGDAEEARAVNGGGRRRARPRCRDEEVDVRSHRRKTHFYKRG